MDPTQIVPFFENLHLGIVAVVFAVAKVVIRLRRNQVTAELDVERLSSEALELDVERLSPEALEYTDRSIAISWPLYTIPTMPMQLIPLDTPLQNFFAQFIETPLAVVPFGGAWAPMVQGIVHSGLDRYDYIEIFKGIQKSLEA